jgi:hypothetical protein
MLYLMIGARSWTGGTMPDINTILAWGMAAVIVAALGIGAVIFLQQRSRIRAGLQRGYFAPRFRRLNYVEAISLEKGRRLLLVRRDNVEHLVMIGGPIDLVIETGITPSQRALHYDAESPAVGDLFASSSFFSPAAAERKQEPILARDHNLRGATFMNGEARGGATSMEPPLELSLSHEVVPEAAKKD